MGLFQWFDLVDRVNFVETDYSLPYRKIIFSDTEASRFANALRRVLPDIPRFSALSEKQYADQTNVLEGWSGEEREILEQILSISSKGRFVVV